MNFSRPTAVAASVILVLLLVSASEAAIQCSDVVKALTPCTNYLKSGGTPTSACCAGVSQLNSLASTSADRKAVCGCLKDAEQKMNPSEAAAKNLPGSCGVTQERNLRRWRANLNECGATGEQAASEQVC